MALITRIVMQVLLVLVEMWATQPASAAMSAWACKYERHVAVNASKTVLYGSPPSPQCCLRLQATPFECVCPVITPKIAPLIDVNRASRIVEGCGRRVPRHFKCGSITTPRYI